MLVSFLKHKTIHVAPPTLEWSEQDGVKSTCWNGDIQVFCHPRLRLHHLLTMWAEVLMDSFPTVFPLGGGWSEFVKILRCRNTWQKYTKHRGIKPCTHTHAAAEQTGNTGPLRSLSCFIVCFAVLSVFLYRSLQGEKSVWESWLPAWIPAPDHVWGTWGNHPAQRQFAHEQIN